MPGETTALRGFGPGGAATAVLTEHSLRRGLAAEVHARPHEELPTPVRVSHLALAHDAGENAFAAERDSLLALCDQFKIEPPPSSANFFAANFGRFRLRWERHTEFSTYTLFRFDPFESPFAEPAIGLVPAAWLANVPGQVLTAVHMAVERRWLGGDAHASRFDCEAHLTPGGPLVGCGVSGGAGNAWTDFQIHGDGFGRVLLHNFSLTPGQTGRLVQRFLEIDTYRMMALLALPLARETAPALTRIETGVAEVIAELARTGDRDDRARLGRLSELAAEAEHLANATGYRFAAARAYYDIIYRRIDALREVRLPGVQTVAEFMERRLSPAMLTCTSTAERQEALSRRIARAGDLLRTRVDIEMEENNRDLLRSMDQRARIQLRLQETVEGLSVVAISYYALSLLGYAFKGAKAAALLPVTPEVAMAVALPVVVGIVMIGLRRLRRGHKSESGE
ncbi:MAG: DUF3422 domain-containing protein [Alphaproteobacteria bacterium]|nr:DUF3422 domain-containing protein [Alphaproteobacteria bacterium]